VCVLDIDECTIIPNICMNGHCVNTDGSFYCECLTGFRYDTQLHICAGALVTSDGQITNEIRSRCQPNDNSSTLCSLCVKCHQCTSDLTVNVSAKIRDGTITEINSLTPLQ